MMGESWMDGFVHGLLQSDVILLLCSEGSTEAVKKAHEKSSNMLLEVSVNPPIFAAENVA